MLIYDAADTPSTAALATDTLRLDGSGVTSTSRRSPTTVIQGMEVSNLTGAAQHLTLALVDVLNLSDKSDTITIDGNVNDAGDGERRHVER